MLRLCGAMTHSYQWMCFDIYGRISYISWIYSWYTWADCYNNNSVIFGGIRQRARCRWVAYVLCAWYGMHMNAACGMQCRAGGRRRTRWTNYSFRALKFVKERHTNFRNFSHTIFIIQRNFSKCRRFVSTRNASLAGAARRCHLYMCLSQHAALHVIHEPAQTALLSSI